MWRLLPILFISLACHAKANSGTSEIQSVLGAFGNLTSVAGGNGGGSGNPNEWNVSYEGGPAMAAELSEPHMAMDDAAGNIYVADKNAHAIRKITPDGLIYTVAGAHRFVSPNVGAFNGDGIATEKFLSFPNGLYVLPDGTFYILEAGDAGTSSRIRRVSRQGVLTTLHSEPGNSLQRGLWVSLDETTLYFCTSTQLKRLRTDLPQDATNPRVLMNLSSSSSLANIDVDQSGNILVADRTRNRIYLVPPTANSISNPTVVAGNGVGGTSLGNNQADTGDIATNVILNETRGVAYHPCGGYFVACHKGGDIWYVDTQSPPRVHFLIRGDDRDPNNNPLRLGDGQPITVDQNVSKLAEPRSIRYGWNGDLIICCNDSGFVRVVQTNQPKLPLTVTQTTAGTLQWTGEPSKTYFVEATSQLQPGNWQTLAWRTPNTAGLQNLTRQGVLPGREFYRVTAVRRWPF
jgi:hypothetical protein